MSRTALVLTTLFAATATPAWADAVADFYAGKQIRFIIRTGSATSCRDSYSRLLALPHRQAHSRQSRRSSPSTCRAAVVSAPPPMSPRSRRRTARSCRWSAELPVDQALGLNTTFQADLRDFHWIGNISSSNQVLATWHTSPTRTLADLMKREPGGSDRARQARSQRNYQAVLQQYRRHQDQDRLRLSGRRRHQHRDGARRGQRPRGQSVGELHRQPAALHREEADQSDRAGRAGARRPACPTWR